MPKHFALVAVTAVAVAHAARTRSEARKAAQLYLFAHNEFKKTEAANHAQINYLVSLLEEHNVQPTEFDLIALHYHSE